ncbi:hypothetical protein JNO04_01215 [Halomonas sp. MC140]|nr:hypothetical protein [Halomonas sp. MC140]MDN7130970.1 hypothetical protein [Halomonas sp. MC140]
MSKGEFSISPEEFVQEFKDLKGELVGEYFSSDSEISQIKN